MERDDDGMCACGRNKETDPHPCPYKQEIDGDDDLCTCCEECEKNCEEEI